MKKQSGFSAIEALLIFVIVAILGGTGWYVYSAHNKTSDTYTNADSANSSTVSYKKKTTTTKDPTADWVAYSDKDGQFSLKYPKTWATATHPELCSPGIFLLGGDSKSVGVCASESFGQVSLVSVAGDSQKDNELSTGYSGVTTSSVTVDSVKGQKQTGTASGQSNDAGIGVLADGTVVVKYTFFTNNRTYTATYTKTVAYPDVLNDFNTLVTKTLKFSS